jgi:enediyne polyketide synthase
MGRTLPWVAPLLGPYLERKVRELAPGAELSVAIGRNGSSAQAMEQALGFRASVSRRPDGKPEVNGHRVSAAHAADFVGAVAGSSGCDIEVVSERPPAVWQDILGAERFALAELIVRESEDDASVAATRVWCAMECLKKSGASGRPLVLEAARPDGWIELCAGPAKILTYSARMRGLENRLAFAVIVEP